MSTLLQELQHHCAENTEPTTHRRSRCKMVFPDCQVIMMPLSSRAILQVKIQPGIERG